MRTRLLGYFTTYRWELWLLIGIPAVSRAVSVVSHPFSAILLSDRVGGLSIINSSQVVIGAAELVVGIVGLLLLSVFYLRVRRLERELLALEVLHRDSDHRRCCNNSCDCRRSCSRRP